MANQLAPLLTVESPPPPDHDSSTNTLIARYRAERARS